MQQQCKHASTRFCSSQLLRRDARTKTSNGRFSLPARRSTVEGAGEGRGGCEPQRIARKSRPAQRSDLHPQSAVHVPSS